MDYPAHTPQQLSLVLRGRRKGKKLSQQSAGARVGLLPKTISALESSPEGSTVGSLFKLLSALELDLVIRSKPSIGASGGKARSKTTDW